GSDRWARGVVCRVVRSAADGARVRWATERGGRDGTPVGDNGFGGHDQMFDDRHRRRAAARDTRGGARAVADDGEIPAARADGGGGDQSGPEGEGGKALGAAQGADETGGAVAQAGGGLETLGAGVAFDQVEQAG